MRYLCFFLVLVALGGCRTSPPKPDNPPPTPPSDGDGEPADPDEPVLDDPEAPRETEVPGWPWVNHLENVSGKTAQSMLDSILAGSIPVGLKEAAENRKLHKFFYDSSAGPAHDRAHTEHEGWMRVAIAYHRFQNGEFNEAELELERGGFDLGGDWGTTAFASPDMMGDSMLDELMFRLGDWATAPGPVLYNQIKPRIEKWLETFPDLPDAYDVLNNRTRWTRVACAWVAAGQGGEPDWYFCLDELEHCP